jgi:signal transduction histidine kinase
LATSRTDPAPSISPERLFEGPGEMRALLRATDWAPTGLGPVSAWPQSLRTAVSICINSRFPIVLWWGPQLFTVYNDGYRPMLGIKHPRALGAPGITVWPEIWAIIDPMLRGVMERREATWSADQLLLLERNGYPEECYFTFSYSPIEDESGGVGGVFCAVTETTERVLAERRLRALRELGAPERPGLTDAETAAGSVRLLVGDGADAPWAILYALADEDTRLVEVAAAGEGAASAPSALAADGSGWPLAEAAWSAARIGVACSATLADGAEAMALPVRGDAGDQVTGVLVAGVSPRLRLDDAYRGFFELAAGHIGGRLAAARAYAAERRRAEALAELDRAKTAFFSNVSHELRTPLTLQLGPLQDLLSSTDAPLSDRQRELVRLAHRNSQRLLKLVNTLLEFSRLEAGRVAARFEATDLAGLTAEVARAFREAIERTGLGFRVDTPPLGEPVWVDRGMWEKIVLNLLSNALKYTLHGGITISLRREDGGVELAVADTGTGIPAAELPRLFTRFHRVNNPHGRTQEGTGIGLALVAELARLHGGEVTVESEEGRGSVFRVRLPLGRGHLPPEHVVEAPEREAAALDAAPYLAEALRWEQGDAGRVRATGEHFTLDPSEVRAAGVPDDLLGARVLVADDNADMRDYLRGLLAEAFSVEAVGDGRTALARARAALPDLVLSDVMMPELDGFALLEALRADPATRDVPVVLVSARAGEEARAEGLAAGADDDLVKPFVARELLARVAGAVRVARLRRDAAAAQRAALAELVDSHGRLRLATEAAGLGIFTWDVATDHPLWHNERMYRILGRTREEGPISYQELVDGVLFPEDVPGFEASMRSAMQPGESFAWRGRMRLSHGVRWIEYYARFELNPDGTPRRLLGVVRDVTDEHEVEERLRHAQRMEAAGQLAGGIAHEANNQMTVVLGAAHFLQREAKLPPALQNDLAAIERAAQRTATITRQLLAFSRRQMVQPVVLSLNELVTGLEQVIERTITEAVRLVLELDPGDPTVRADRGQLEQVVLNLVLNARDAMPSGGTLRLRTGLCDLDAPTLREHGYGSARTGRYARLDVEDTGIGMGPATLGRAFEPFFTTKEPGEGTGLGLAAVYGIVQQAGGYVWATSQPGAGTQVVVCLPLETMAAPDAPPTPPARTSAPGPRRRLLVVEDEPMVREMAVRILREEGHEVLEAKHGAEALELLDREPGVAAVVSDVVMPVVGGRELAERMAARGLGGIPILYMSGYTNDEVVRRGLLDAGRPFLQKPFRPEDLAERVEGMLVRR